jgi:excisionase family DNA binding protein
LSKTDASKAAADQVSCRPRQALAHGGERETRAPDEEPGDHGAAGQGTENDQAGDGPAREVNDGCGQGHRGDQGGNAANGHHLVPGGRRLGLSTSEAARHLGVSLSTIRRWSDMGHLRGYRTPGGQRRFSVEQLDAFLTSLEQENRF